MVLDSLVITMETASVETMIVMEVMSVVMVALVAAVVVVVVCGAPTRGPGPYLHQKILRTQMTGSTQRYAWTGIGLPACSGTTGFLLELLESH